MAGKKSGECGGPSPRLSRIVVVKSSALVREREALEVKKIMTALSNIRFVYDENSDTTIFYVLEQEQSIKANRRQHNFIEDWRMNDSVPFTSKLQGISSMTHLDQASPPIQSIYYSANNAEQRERSKEGDAILMLGQRILQLMAWREGLRLENPVG
ncbi:unnamed protein product [Dovyalis caffra]|uniref:Uncharacterized protein n=1 Tax=Dovyalis caffra TaxID=77055 RepID=A0AAV1R1X5_9ROSI|nr:unnamed protein product [Dovyalis caffra]